jgi:hypothetical protein
MLLSERIFPRRHSPVIGNRHARRRLAGNVGSCVMFIGVTNKRQTDAASLRSLIGTFRRS